MARSSDFIFPVSLWKDKSFKMRQVRRVLLLTLFFIIQSTIILGVFYHYLLGEMVAGTAPMLFASEDLIKITESVPSASEVMMRWVLIMLGINALITTAIGVYIIRKLGNPILAMRRVLTEMGDGNLDVRLRAGDDKEFSELTDALNRALDTVHSKVETARQHTRIVDSLDQQPRPDAKEIENALVQCRDTLSFFDHGTVVDGSQPAANG